MNFYRHTGASTEMKYRNTLPESILCPLLTVWICPLNIASCADINYNDTHKELKPGGAAICFPVETSSLPRSVDCHDIIITDLYQF